MSQIAGVSPVIRANRDKHLYVSVNSLHIHIIAELPYICIAYQWHRASVKVSLDVEIHSKSLEKAEITKCLTT